MMDLMSPFVSKILQRADGQNIIVLMSGQGGNGKTWVSITMAGILAQMGQKVLLFDGDLGLANIDVQLGLTSVQDVTPILTSKVPMNQAIIFYAESGFDVITGRSATHSLQSLERGSLELIKNDLMLLATHYDTVIVDLGSSSDAIARVFSKGVGTILMFSTDEITALTQARTLLKMVADKGVVDKVGLVINAVSSFKEGNRTYYTLVKACDDFLKKQLPLSGVIRRDSCVVEALNNRLSVLNAYPDCEAVKDVKMLVDGLQKKIKK